jgi:hypothetical protein
VPGVAYTTIGTRVDEVIQPATNVALRDAAAVNLVVQAGCPVNQSGHFRLPYDDYTIGLAIAVLDPALPAAACTPVALGAGILEMVISENT